MSHYKVEPPAIISVSGGRTSGFMLCKIVAAYGGTLPPDVIPAFCNTGLEHAATYDFLRDLGSRIAPIRWLEYRSPPDEPATFAEVGYDTASRHGEPFSALIRRCNYVPNPITRRCTADLKIKTAANFARSLGWDHWDVAIGLRADESRRVASVRSGRWRERYERILPIADAGNTIQDVRDFWRTMQFDLKLPNDDNAFGNCVGCFLKSKQRLIRVERAEPGSLTWWAEAEAEAARLSSRDSGARFRNDRPSYAGLIEQARRQGTLFDDQEEDSLPCDCTA